jgi:hypothetical protein
MNDLNYVRLLDAIKIYNAKMQPFKLYRHHSVVVPHIIRQHVLEILLNPENDPTGRYLRYCAYNFANNREGSSGTVEFRQHEGTLDGERAVNWCKACVALVRLATQNTLPAELSTAGDQGYAYMTPDLAELIKKELAFQDCHCCRSFQTDFPTLLQYAGEPDLADYYAKNSWQNGTKQNVYVKGEEKEDLEAAIEDGGVRQGCAEQGQAEEGYPGYEYEEEDEECYDCEAHECRGCLAHEYLGISKDPLERVPEEEFAQAPREKQTVVRESTPPAAWSPPRNAGLEGWSDPAESNAWANPHPDCPACAQGLPGDSLEHNHKRQPSGPSDDDEPSSKRACP